MIDRAHRFHRLGSLRPAYKYGQTLRGPFNALKYMRNTHRKDWRAAVVVSRKVHKSAVVRNRIRRRIFEILRSQGPAINGPYDLIFIAYSDQLATLSTAELQDCIISQLREANVLADEGQSDHAIVRAKE